MVSSEIPEATGTTGEGANTSPAPTPEPDDVYYHLGGATISTMLHQCYSNIHLCPFNKRKFVVEQITILRNVMCSDKSILSLSPTVQGPGVYVLP